MDVLIFSVFLLVIFIPATEAIGRENSEYWEQYGNDEKGHRFSPLTLINKDNVKQLEIAWKHTYYREDCRSYYHEATPIMVEDGNGTDILVYCSPWGAVYGLDPVNGTMRWNQSSYANTPGERSYINTGTKTCRGVTSWLDPQKQDGDLCRRVIYLNTITAWLVAMDASTGALCLDFGEGGAVNLTVPRSFVITNNGLRKVYGMTSAPEIVRNVVVTGDSISDGTTIYSPGGHPRGWHCRTGQLMWQFDVIPDESDTEAYATWSNGTKDRGGGNVWAPIGGDHDTGLVYIATSSPHFDFWGGDRVGDNLYTDSVIAIDVETGVKKWHYQIVRHDIWNYDLGSQPSVTTVTKDGVNRKVVLQATKMGSLFILDALTGKSLYPVEEVPVPKSNVPGEVTAATQPVPRGKLGRLAPTTFSVDDLYTESPFPAHREFCTGLLLNETMLNITSGRTFTPGGWWRAEMWVPGEAGGSNWGSLSVHPGKQWAILPLNHIITVLGLVPRNMTNDQRPKWCTSTNNMEGTPIIACRGRFMGERQLNPCMKPPWARLTAVDLKTGEVVWEKPYGDNILQLTPTNITSSRKFFGGVLLTDAGLIISSGTEDFNMWIHDVETGELLHSVELEYDTVGTPSTYMTDGEQYIVVNSGKGMGIPSAWSDGCEIVALKVPGAKLTTPITSTTPTTATPTPPDNVVCGASHVGPVDVLSYLMLTIVVCVYF